MYLKNLNKLINNRKKRLKQLRKLILESINACLKQINPKELIKNNVSIKSEIMQVSKSTINLNNISNIYMIGGGKASGLMALELARILNSIITEGLVISSGNEINELETSNVKIINGTHPLPSEKNIQATNKMLEIASKATRNDLVIGLISGGGSALINLPPPGISIQDIQDFYQALISQDLDIITINTLRKHVSQVKGGWLALACHPALMVNLIISDVLNDPIEYIASGPTCPDRTTFKDCIKLIEDKKIKNIPESIIKHLQKGANKEIPDTPKPGNKCFENVQNHIIGSNKIACKTIKNFLQERGHSSKIISHNLQGNVSILSEYFMNLAREKMDSKTFYIFGGESTVELGNQFGKGGRNQELCLHVIKKFQNIPGTFIFCSFGTDGIDGNSDAAGAIVDVETMKKALSKGLSVDDFIRRHDSYNFFEELGDGHLITGPTGTNVADLMILYVEK
ncbi:MAG: glycerate kinase type-2 family protein [Candidatus Helarchaeales archaeon]